MTTRKLRVLLVDDEALARRRLVTLLAGDDGVEVVGECENGAEAVRAITELHPDLVFLDVQMPELDGFEVIDAIGTDKMPPVIFVTAFDDYAVNAFEHGAVDYLLKPVEAERFARTVARARAHIGGEAAPSEGAPLSDRLAALLDSIGRGDARRRIGIRVGGRIVFLDPDEIFWIEARDDIARVHLADSFHDVRETLSRLESRLPGELFMRVHRSAIINTGKIREVQPFDQGDQLIVLGNGKRVMTSRSYRKAIQAFLKQST